MAWAGLLLLLVGLAAAEPADHTATESRLLRWLAEEGGVRTEHLRFADFSGSGRGLQALAPLAAGEPIVSVPRRLHMTSRDAWQVFHSASIDLSAVRPTGCEALAMLLMREAGDGGSGGSGRWAPYVATLPRSTAVADGVSNSSSAMPQVPTLLIKAMEEAHIHAQAVKQGGGGGLVDADSGTLAPDVAEAAAAGNALFGVLENSPTTRNVLGHRLTVFERRAAELEDALWRHHPPAAFGLGRDDDGATKQKTKATKEAGAAEVEETAPWEVELTKPAPERRRVLWRWASSMVSSRAWRGELGKDGGPWEAWWTTTATAAHEDRTGDGGVGCSLVPLADMLNHKAGAGSLQFAEVAAAVAAAAAPTVAAAGKEKESVAQILATRAYRVGEQLHDTYVTDANATGARTVECNLYLLWNFGFVEADDGGARGCAFIDLAIPAALAAEARAARVLRAHGFLKGTNAPAEQGGAEREKFTLHGGGAATLHGPPHGPGDGVMDRMVQLLRLLSASEDEMAVEDARRAVAEQARTEEIAARAGNADGTKMKVLVERALLAPALLSLTNEIKVLKQLERALDDFVGRFGSSVKADEAAAVHATAAAREVAPTVILKAEDTAAPLLARATALRLRAGEQRALLVAKAGLQQRWNALYWHAFVHYAVVPGAVLLSGGAVMRAINSP